MRVFDFKDLSKQLIQCLKKYKRILIYIKGSPDPDVIASSFALSVVCNAIGIKSTIVSVTNTSLPQNKAIINDLKIPIQFRKSHPDVSNFDCYAIMDFQSAYVKGISGNLPCALHVDHHERLDENLEVNLKIIIEDAGSVSTIMALILSESKLEIDTTVLKKISTALYYGIQTDTSNFSNLSKLDKMALEFLNKYADPNEIKNITEIPLSEEVVGLFKTAVKNQVIYRDWIIAGLGIINQSKRDSIAIVADYLLQNENIEIVIVFALIQKEKGLILDASLRTRNKRLNLNDLIKNLSPIGGASKLKGAFQVNLDYFCNSSELDSLWEVVYKTTIQKLKTQRDLAPYLEIKGFFNFFKRTAKKIVTNLPK
jgi:phosphoglycolate phosphatase